MASRNVGCFLRLVVRLRVRNNTNNLFVPFKMKFCGTKTVVGKRELFVTHKLPSQVKKNIVLRIRVITIKIARSSCFCLLKFFRSP